MIKASDIIHAAMGQAKKIPIETVDLVSELDKVASELPEENSTEDLTKLTCRLVAMMNDKKSEYPKMATLVDNLFSNSEAISVVSEEEKLAAMRLPQLREDLVGLLPDYVTLETEEMQKVASFGSPNLSSMDLGLLSVLRRDLVQSVFEKEASLFAENSGILGLYLMRILS